MTNAVFEEAPQVEPTLETLVGETGKYKTTDDALKALVHAQAHIQRLEQEAKERREAEALDNKFKELFEKHVPATQVSPAPSKEEPPVVVPAKEELVDLVRQVTQQDREAERVQKNVDEVSSKLIEVYGDTDKANQAVAAKAAELGVSVSFLQEVAARSPKAFYAQIGVTATAQSTPTPSQSTVNLVQNPTSSGQGKPGTYSYYKELKRTNPSVYFHPKTQIEMHNAGLKYGAGWSET